MYLWYNGLSSIVVRREVGNTIVKAMGKGPVK